MDKEEPSVTEEKQSTTRLVDVEVADENVALNLLVGFVSIAQRRGVFSMEESSKIWECIKKFQKPPV
jgi:translation initiation factor 6 (eIF-6)